MNSLPTLKTRLDIKAVYWVDDENASSQELDANKLASMLADQLEANDADARKKSLGQLRKVESARGLADAIAKALAADGDEDVVGTVLDLLTGKLDKVVNDPVATLNDMLGALPQPLGPQERAGLAKVFQGDKWAWEPMSFSRWHEEHKAILNKHAQGNNNALLIVDLQNTRESSSVSGEQILAQWAQHVSKIGGRLPIYAVALTSKYKENQELIEGRRFTKKLFDNEPDPSVPVLVISKDRLSSDSDEDTERLVAAAVESTLSRLRACTLHTTLATELSKIFAHSSNSAFQALQQLSIEEMIYAVSASSFYEGASEVDTLVRMASIAQREALLNALLRSQTIPEALIELRGLHGQIGFVKANELDSTDGIEKLRCSELHDPPEVVNQLLSPISTGDIFEVSDEGGQKEYHVLVSNACDLSLRGVDGERTLNNGLLLKLRQVDGAQKKSEDGPTAPYRISHFPASSPLANQQQSVDLRCMLTIPLMVLDLCWTNTDGCCRWNKEGKLPTSFGLLPSQSNRYKKICERMASIKSDEDLRKLAHWVRRTSQFDQDTQLDQATQNQDAQNQDTHQHLKQVEFSIRRIGRLATSVAAELNNKFAQAIARPSQEHDFSAAKE